MNRWSYSTRIVVPQPSRTFSRKVQSLGKVGLLISMLTLLALAGGGCETDAHSSTLSGQAEVPKHVILAPGDVVKLTFSANSELNQSQKIRADGKLSLPLVGEVDAAQKSVAQLQSELVELYKPQIKIPEVTVSLEKSATTVTVSGAVSKPGRIGFERPTTVFEAIMEAGGPTSFGNLGHVRLIRTVNGIQKSQVLDLHRTLKGEETKPFYVRDQDVIYVPQSTF